MEDGSKDYLTVYRQFFENFASTVDLDDQLPVKVASYNIAESEIPGEIVDWCLQYLNQRNCPDSLVIPLCRKVLEEIIQMCKKHPDFCGYRTEEDDFHTLRLMQATTRKLVEVCIRYTDNALLCSLPPPPPQGSLVAPPVSAYAIKNARRTMEDRHVAIQDLHALFDIKDCGSASYYGVFDGHNGADAAVYCVSHLHQYLAESSYYPANPELALKDAFRRTDDRFNNKSDKENLRSGTTAVCALLRPKESMLYVAWIGDSQAVLVNQGKPYQLVKPHKPDQPEERERIEEMGGTVLYWGTWRVNGLLAVSRAIGDIEYKPYVSGEPDLRVIPLTGQEDFLVLACDGLWDFMSEQEVTDCIYKYLSKYPEDIEGVSKHLAQVGKAQGSTDNISVLVVFLKERGCKLEEKRSERASTSGSVSTSASSSSSGISGSGSCGGGVGGMEVFVKQNGRAGATPAPPAVPIDDDDFGPETDVDSVDDVLLSPSIAAAKALAAHSPVPGLGAGEVWVPRGKLELQQESWLKTLPWSYAEALRKPPPLKTTQQHQQPPPTVEEVNNDVVGEGEAESGEDSEEEWNYIRGEQKEIEKKKEEELEDDESDMESRLNPNAAEFVPGMALEKTLEDIVVPPMKDFYSDIAEKPSQIEPLCEKINTSAQDVSLNGGDETEILSTKAEFGDESAYSMSMSMNTSMAFTVDDETKETSEQQDTFENEFVKDHFASPLVELKKEETSGELPEEEGTTDPFIIRSDFERNLTLETNMTETSVWPSNRPVSPPNDLDSPYDFMSNTDKSDALSPVDLPERHPLGANQEPTSSSGFDSESNEEIDSNIQEKLVDSISFGDVDEVVKYKEEDSALLKETVEDSPPKESEMIMTELVAVVTSLETDDLIRVEEQVEEGEMPASGETELVCIEQVEQHQPETCLELPSPDESPKKFDEDDESTQPLDSPTNEILSFSHEQIQETPVNPLLTEEEPEQQVSETPEFDENLKDAEVETKQTVDFIQDLQFNGGMKEEEDGQHSNENTMESEIEAGFEIISHETAVELQEESKFITELSSTEEKLLTIQKETELSSPQNEVIDELCSLNKVPEEEVTNIDESTDEINHSSNVDIFKTDDYKAMENSFIMEKLESPIEPPHDSFGVPLPVETQKQVNDLVEAEIKENIFETEVLLQDLVTEVVVEETKQFNTETVIEHENHSGIESGSAHEELVGSVDETIEAVKEETKEEIVTTAVIEDEKSELSEKVVDIKDLTHMEEMVGAKPPMEEILVFETEKKEEKLIEVIDKSENFQDHLSGFIIEKMDGKYDEISRFNESIVKEDVKVEVTEGFENVSKDHIVRFTDGDKYKNDVEVLNAELDQIKNNALEDFVINKDKLDDKTPILNENMKMPQEVEESYKSEQFEQIVNEVVVKMDNEVKVTEIIENLIVKKEVQGLITETTEVQAPSSEELALKKPDNTCEEESTKPSPLEIEGAKLAPLDSSVSTPPSTPAPGVTDDNSKGLLAAAVVAAATVAGAATVAAVTTPTTKAVEKPSETIKPGAAASPKKPAVQAKAGTKPGVTAKSPTKAGTAAPVGGVAAKKAVGAPATKTSAPVGKMGATATSKASAASAKPTGSTAKPATSSGKPATAGGKPPTPTAKTGTSAAAKTVSSSSPSKPLSKPSTPTAKAPVKTTATKPTTPTGTAKPKLADAGISKPKAGTATTKPPTEKAPTKEVAKKPAVTSTAKPPTATKTGAASAPTKAAPMATKPAAVKAPTSVPGAAAKPKAAPSKPPAATPAAAPKPKAPSRPTSAKPAAPATKTAPAKAAAPPSKPAQPKPAAPKPAAAPPAKSAAPAAAKPKAPVAPSKTKQAPVPKKPAPTEKSVKEATNNKLSTAKSQGKKEIIEDKERRVLGDEPATQEHLVTTTNGHVDIIENGIGNGRDSPIDKSHPEIAVSLN